MDFFRIKSPDPSYQKLFGNHNVQHFNLYTNQGDLIGDIADVWVDELGRSHYFVVDMNGTVGKRILVPFSQFQIDSNSHRIYVSGLDASQIGTLPVVQDDKVLHMTESSLPNTGREGTILQGTAAMPHITTPLEVSAPLEASAPLESPIVLTQRSAAEVRSSAPEVLPVSPTRELAHEPAAVIETPSQAVENPMRPVNPVSVNTIDTEKIRLLEEKLVVNRRRQKVGEVIVRKTIETEMIQVPVRRERLIVEQVSPMRKELASIDLSGGDLSAVELADSLNAREQLQRQEAILPVQAANQLLSEIANRPQYQQARVRLEFEDPQLQAEYQQHLQQYFANRF